MTIKAREARERLKGKADPQVSYCIESIIEQQNVLREQLHDCAQQMDLIVNIVSDITQVAAGMQSIKDKVEGKEHITDGNDVGKG